MPGSVSWLGCNREGVLLSEGAPLGVRDPAHDAAQGEQSWLAYRVETTETTVSVLCQNAAGASAEAVVLLPEPSVGLGFVLGALLVAVLRGKG